MLIIERNLGALGAYGYTVRAKEQGMGRGWTSEAKNIMEVSLAIEHYYERHANNGVSLPTCPFCTHSEQEQEKLRKDFARRSSSGKHHED